MTVLYRILGAVARASETLSHTRVNLIPANVAIIFALGLVGSILGVEAREAFLNTGSPRQVRVQDIVSHKDVDHTYVSVVGVLGPVAFTETDESGKHVDRVWAPMLDAQLKRAVLVQVPSEGAAPGKPKIATVTGLLKQVPGDLRKKLVDELGGKIGPATVDTQYMVVQGRRPGHPVLLGASALVLGILFALGLITFLMKYVVFQPTPIAAVSMAASADGPIDLRLTGALSLDAKHRQRFLNVPAAMGTLEGGETAFASSIDASTRFYGVTTQERRGMWLTAIKQGTLQALEPGLLYIGMATRPAVRLRFREAGTGRPETAILSFADEAQRAAVMSDLEQSRMRQTVVPV